MRIDDLAIDARGDHAVAMNRLGVAVRALIVLAALACLLMSLLALSGCGQDDKSKFVGEWQIQNTEVTVVFSDTQFKQDGYTFDYTVDSANKTITYQSGGIDMGSATYSFSDNGKKLTLEQDNGTFVFDKLSDNGNAEPSVGGLVEDAQS